MSHKLILPIPFLALLVSCGEPPRETRNIDSRIPMSVETVEATTEDWPLLYETTGTVRAGTSTVISAKWMGYVRAVAVHIGDHVREGQLLVSLDPRDLDSSSRRAEAARETVRQAIPGADSAVVAARANLDLEQATFRRMQQLYEKKSISDHEFDEASARIKSSQAAYDLARAKRTQLDAQLAQAAEEIRASEVARSYAEIVAPFAGVVTAKSVENGTLATPGAPLLTLEREGAYRLEASVEESHLGTIRLGQPVSVNLDGIDRTVEAHVSEIVPAVDAASHSYLVKLDLPSLPALRSGVFGRAAFLSGKRSVTAVPVKAVTERGQLQSVWVDDNGVARTRLITAGEKEKDRVEILSGLNAGEKIVFPIPAGLADGAPIRTEKAGATP
jgi:membrane fusion protein, multidrug efflux system